MKRLQLASALSLILSSEPRGANTLTGLIPSMYEALDVVSRELVGYIPAVSRDSTADRAAVNQAVTFPIVPASLAADITPGVTPPNDGDQTIGTDSLLITKARAVPFRWNGEEQLGLASGITRAAIQKDQIAQAFRTLCNEIEVDLAVAAYKGASRAFGTAGTAPFATVNDLSDIAQLKKMMDDNGAPKGNRRLVLGTTAMASLGSKQASLFKVNEAGSDQLLREGIVGRLQGFDVGDSGQTQTPTKGTGAAYTSTAAGFAVGTTSIPIITGTGTVLAGDVVTFAGDSNKYVVLTGVAAPGTIVLQQPGLRQAIPAVATAMTVGNTATQNSAFGKHAIQLVTRAPALPAEGDMARDRMMITDPVSGLTFELALYPLYRQVRYELSIAWGVKVTNGKHVMNLLG